MDGKAARKLDGGLRCLLRMPDEAIVDAVEKDRMKGIDQMSAMPVETSEDDRAAVRRIFHKDKQEF